MAGGQFLSVSADITAAQEALAGTSKSLAAIQKGVLRIAAKGTAQKIRAAIRSSDLERRTGELLKAYTYKVKKDGSEANVFPRALGASGKDRHGIFPKAMTLSYGHSGATKRAKDWSIKARGFVQTGRQYAEGGAYGDAVQAYVDKELAKYWGS